MPVLSVRVSQVMADRVRDVATIRPGWNQTTWLLHLIGNGLDADADLFGIDWPEPPAPLYAPRACEWCGMSYTPARPWAKFCRTSCRVRSHEARHAAPPAP